MGAEWRLGWNDGMDRLKAHFPYLFRIGCLTFTNSAFHDLRASFGNQGTMVRTFHLFI